MRCIDNNKSRVIEGKIRCKELVDYLDSLGGAKRVWISEDATALSVKVNYDPKTNQLVGITLPIDVKTGSTISLVFDADNEDVIKEHLKKPWSSYVYLVLAQALDESIPPFVLQMFGTNNEFRSTDVVKRWSYYKQELNK